MTFGGSFWSFLNFQHNSQIDSLLSNNETTLEDLLKDENILTEFKSLNPKLLDYCSDDKIKQLIGYIIEEPPADADKDRGYKFPFVSCEILTADIETILESVFGRNPNNLRKHDTESDYSGKADHHEDEEHSGEDHSGDRDIELEQNETEKKEEHSQEEKEKEKEKEAPASDKEEPSEKKDTELKSEDEDKKNIEEQKSIESETAPEQEIEKKPSEELAKYLFSFLDKEELNVTLVGYFARFLNHIIIRKPNEIYQYVWQHPEIIDKFIAHIEHKAIADCLAKLFTLEKSSPKSDEFVDVKIEKLKNLVSLFKSDAENPNEESIANAAACLVDILSKKSTLHGKEQFAKYFASEDFLDLVFDNLFGNKTLTTNIALVLNALLSHLLQNPEDNADDNNELDSPTKNESPETPVQETCQDKLYSCLYSKAGDIVEYLDQQNEAARDVTFGTQKVPLGTARLRLVELVLYAIKLDVNKVSSEFALKGLYKVLMRLMVDYEWNNLLHNHIERIIVSTLESDSHVLRQKLLNNADLLGFLLESTKEVDYTFSNAQHRKVRRGYLGHLTRIARLLERLAERDNDIKEYLNNERWAEFKKKYLDVTLEKDNYDLAKSTRKTTNEFFEDMMEKKDGELERHHEGMEEGEDDLNDREYDDGSKDRHQDFIHHDIFSKYEGGFDEWGKNDGNEEGHEGHEGHEGQKDHKLDIWSMAPADFSTTFKFTGFPEIPKEVEPDMFVELNRKQEIIDIGPQHEAKLEKAYFDNAFWAKPLNKAHDVDDILKEFEGH